MAVNSLEVIVSHAFHTDVISVPKGLECDMIPFGSQLNDVNCRSDLVGKIVFLIFKIFQNI